VTLSLLELPQTDGILMGNHENFNSFFVSLNKINKVMHKYLIGQGENRIVLQALNI
jgi:hypothetical protein